MDLTDTKLADVGGSLERVGRRVGEHYQGMFGPEAVAEAVRASFDRVTRAGALSAFVYGLTEHEAIERLRVAGLAQGLIPKVHPEVLFVSNGGARARLAAALTEERSNDRVIVRVASARAHWDKDPNVETALQEIGAAGRALTPAPLTEDAVAAADAVVTMDCAELLTEREPARLEDWNIGDPAGASLDEVRRIRDELDARVRALLERLSPGTTQA